jgi:hypothetical protein
MIRIIKFTVPASVLTEFLDYINSKGLKSTIGSKKEDMYEIEVAYTKEQEPIIDEMEALVGVLVVLALASLSALSYLAEAAQKSPVQNTALEKPADKKQFLFKDFVSQNVKFEL